MGTLSTLFTNHLIDITMAFVIGASGALGAAFVKYIIDKLKNRNAKEEEETEPYDYE